MIKTIQNIKYKKISWLNDVKKIILKKLINNDPYLVDMIMDYVITEDNILNSNICSYCDEFIHELQHDITKKHYYFMCDNCIKF